MYVDSSFYTDNMFTNWLPSPSGSGVKVRENYYQLQLLSITAFLTEFELGFLQEKYIGHIIEGLIYW